CVWARQAGVHAASPRLVGGLVCAAVALVLLATGRNAAAVLGDAIAAACAGNGDSLQPTAVPSAVLSLVGPVLGVAAIAGVLGHLAQTRAVWLPRRKLAGAPVVERARFGDLGIDLAGATMLAAVALGWLWWTAPSLAVAIGSPLSAARLVTAFVSAIAIAWIAVGALEAIARHAHVAAALRMTAAEKRDDERLAGSDPRWRAHRARHQPSIADQIGGASVVILGDRVAVAIAWHPTHRPIPVCVAVATAARATQLIGLARHHGIAIHREHALAAALAGSEGPVPEPHWPRLAEIIAATRAV
ncbi:MAG: EscU/YscU/HrcU family type III secretion system export apparatus switch protein, partial [Kofleriaceae bacterium]